ncbi:Cilia- and flagella-associated protein 251 [Camelus dromedarius]|uniref:Cilia-and flagella-associated protein 251 n=1 Tax=Camelus dromedarius TaxID=9838 RepID=A0A5N4C8Y1_CAMDR|nr:Cilia- and flagella-associated protein 251 [Camelus dromedarius]
MRQRLSPEDRQGAYRSCSTAFRAQKTPQRRMSDAEENPLEETEEDGEIEVEEEDEEGEYANYKELESAQQQSTNSNMPGWRESQEEGEEEEDEDGEEGEEGEEEEVEEGEEGEEEVEEEVRGKEEEGEEGKEEEKEDEEEWEEEKRVEEKEDGEEEGEEVGEEEEEATGAQEETTVQPQEITEPVKIHSGSASKHSLQSELSEATELSRDLVAQLEFLDLDLTTSGEQQLRFPERQPSGEPGEKAKQGPQDESEQETRDLGAEREALEPEKREKRKGKRVSYEHERNEKEFQPKARSPSQSLVSITTGDILFQKDDSANVYPLTMTWSFGWNSSLPVYYIRDENQTVLLYASAHNAVIYNVLKNNQHHLQGHPNVISCLCISEDRRWVATADKGPNCLIIIWDSFTG